MLNIRRLALCAALIFSAGGLAFAQTPTAPATGPRVFFTMTSVAFEDSAILPTKFTGVDTGVSPPLSWINTPVNTQSFTLLLHDLEPTPARGAGDITHWLMFNIPGTATSLPEGVKAGMAQLPDGTIQAKNVRGFAAYMGPAAPPPNYHHYVFELFALDTKLSLGPDATRAQVMAAMEGHVNGRAILVARYHR